jgi:glutathione synthase/RimK-type ligase-like ATP-grasp enzyme
MKIGIHHRPGSFSDYWIEYCDSNRIAYKLVDCTQSNILQQLEDCDALMWHWYQSDPKGVLFARQLVYSLEAMGKMVYPNSSTCWHFDDKVGQKYLLEAIGAPLVPSFVFYDRNEAYKWVEDPTTTFPKVFKLRGGASSVNVKLVRTRSDAKKLVRIAFGRGFSSRNTFNNLKDRIDLFLEKKNKEALVGVVKGIGKFFISNDFERLSSREKGYVYFQEFMKGNSFDTRVVVVGDRCFGIRRYNRENDFRASGSGKSGRTPDLFDKRCLQIAFDTAARLNTQSIAFDFIFDEKKNPLIVEMSFGFRTQVYPGYWDRNLKWHEGECNSQYYFMETFVESVMNSKESKNSVISLN